MIEFIDNENAIVRNEKSSFTFEVIDSKRGSTEPISPLAGFDNQGYVSRFLDWNVFPYGVSNALPLYIRNIVYSNSIVPGVLSKKTGLNWGKGPKLYYEDYDESNNLTKKFVKDPAIEKWLNSWGYEKFILKATVDFSHIESYYSKVILKKGWRLGDAPFIHKLEHIQAYKPHVVGKKQTPTHIILQNQDNTNDYEIYPLQKTEEDILKSSQSIIYSNLPSFCSDFFSIPQIIGSIPWIIQSTNVPKFLAALSKNSINIKYHITSPKAFWDQKREDIKNQCADKNKPYKESYFQNYRKKLLKEIQEVLSGIENAGKFWHSEQVFVVEGMNLLEVGWKITPIEQNMKDLIDGHVSIANKADRSATTGISVHDSLSNVSDEGKGNYGSGQYYALNNYLQTGIDIPEMVIMDPINFALKNNFPDSGLKIGFFHFEPKQQQDLNKNDRNKIADYGK